ncbi:Molybdenum cofactor biosynthesis protein [Aspergillus sclerotialis]|uniref:molybdopterin adenylyltransferase n=1 Tax=Aspergillus sclerotialis TaxID=2070753 RepID=A0A3A2ZRU1_9EURO|nr:Molybdenum cofactor biosynthesis protein [Aspergillus sclerotialis]
MPDSKLKPAILIVSDTASQNPSTDKSINALSTLLASEGVNTWDEPVTKIVPDNVLDIQRAICSWTDGNEWVNLILVSGGTGFAVKDYTPEAVSPLIHRHASGLVHGMLAASLKVTPFAMMSRPVAGVRDKTLILTLPGSPKGAKENLEAVIKLLPHACSQAAGANSRALHAGGVKKLEADAGIESSASHHSKDHSGHDHHHHHDHSHGHSHGHAIPKAHTSPSERPQSNDPNAGPTRRHRSSPYQMLSVDEALKLISEHTPAPIAIEVPVTTSLVGSVIAEDVYAREAVPAYCASTVDGYAVIAPDSASSGQSTKGTFPVASITHAKPGEGYHPSSQEQLPE